MKKIFSNIAYFLRIYFRYAKKWFWVVALSCLVPPFHAYIDIVLLRDTMDAVGRGERFSKVLMRILLFLLVYLLTTLFEQAIEVYFGETVNVKVSR